MWFPYLLSIQFNVLGWRAGRLGKSNLSAEAKTAARFVYDGVAAFNISCQLKLYHFKSYIPGTAAFNDRINIAKRFITARELISKSAQAARRNENEAKKAAVDPYKIMPRLCKSSDNIQGEALPKTFSSPIIIPKRSKSADDASANICAVKQVAFETPRPRSS